MSKVIELLEKAKADTVYLLSAGGWIIPGKRIRSAIKSIDKAIEELKNTLRWETPEQYEKRTGEAWPDNAMVYCRQGYSNTRWSRWVFMPYKWASLGEFRKIQIVCAPEAVRPPDDWEPEEAVNAE